MSLQDLVRETFAPDGPLARSVKEFLPREGQTAMAMAVARTIENGGVLVVEAGTGIGKTYAYLVPVLLSGERVLVSTATKTLQDQLFGRDLPSLIKALGVPVRLALLKGRSSYLCLQRLETARQDERFSDSISTRTLAKVEQWAQATYSGDLAELPGLDERSPIIPLITSTRENCLGSQCPKIRSCHVNQARREALAADVVVINHHLFFADMAVRESGMAELLPTVQSIVFDEAHQLNETGVQFLGKQLTTGQLLDFARDMLTYGVQLARGFADWQQLAFDTECAARDLRLVVGKQAPGVKLRWVDTVPENVNAAEWIESLKALQAVCTRAGAALSTVSEIAPEFVRLHERVADFAARIESFNSPVADDAVRWLDVGTQLKLSQSPLDIASSLQQKLLDPMAAEGSRKSLVFTSATLGQDARLSWFTERCGLTEAEVLKVTSPFDYASQASLYIPSVFAKPNDQEHSFQVAALVAKAASIIGGRTLVLTTTLRALQAVSEALQSHFHGSMTLDVLVQGHQTKRELLDRFRQGSQNGQSGCILVASASFWEGVDVPGEALQLVVIDKLPFPPPGDPVVEARSKVLEATGRSVFNSYFMPEAAIALRQGAGRLIRRESDRGVLVVCDTRLTAMGYGKRLLASLPPMKKISSETELMGVMAQLTRFSTKDPSFP